MRPLGAATLLPTCGRAADVRGNWIRIWAGARGVELGAVRGQGARGKRGGDCRAMAAAHGLVGRHRAADLGELDDEEHGCPDELDGGPGGYEDGERVFAELGAELGAEEGAFLLSFWRGGEGFEVGECETDEEGDAGHHEDDVDDEGAVVVDGNAIVDPGAVTGLISTWT